MDEAIAYETERTSFVGQVFGFFGVARQPSLSLEDHEVEDVKMNEEDKCFELTDKFEEPVVLQRDDHRYYRNECVEILDWLHNREAWSLLNYEQLRYVQSVMRRETSHPQTRPMVEGDTQAAMICFYSGEANLLQAVK